uniref:tRNA threonylcarbamoyladenosine biosynthesis protein TsaB n=1 Tax=Candidatus Kentrum sp. TC TaxID=2126339 RepID=A0A450YUU3_9GAMM|nr:MAG: tRNA threonylcarbamoyladenosine biosynthesis protein TsaB [Candidatus Kentron sp. TC]
MKSILAIDTSGDACSVALYRDGEYMVSHRLAPRRHAEILLPEIKMLLSQAGLFLRDLDGLAFGRGPGAFTGIRIATGVIQGLAFGADLPVVPVSSLQALAQGAWREHKARHILTALDARMGEVYWGAYRMDIGDLAVSAVEECVCVPREITLPEVHGDYWFGVGSGWATYGEVLSETVERRYEHDQPGSGFTRRELVGFEPNRYPHARDVATLAIVALERGAFAAPEDAQPVYLRNRVTR